MIRSATIQRILSSGEGYKGTVVELFCTAQHEEDSFYTIDDGTGVLKRCYVQPQHPEIIDQLRDLASNRLITLHAVVSQNPASQSAIEEQPFVLIIIACDLAVEITSAFQYCERRGPCEVYFDGWLYSKRTGGKIAFLQLRDGSGICQCVVSKNAVSEYSFELATSLAQESPFAVRGVLQPSPKAPGGFEVQVQNLEYNALEQGDLVYPISPKEHGVEYLMQYRHLWLRSMRPWATMRVRDTLIFAIREFFHTRGFLCFDSPILTPNAAEGTSTLFETKYFDEGMAYLSQSGQLYGEAGAMAFGKVYVFGPTFRAERSKTKRHLNEFWMVEPEVAFMDLEGDMELAEEFVHFVVGRVIAERKPELAILDDNSGRLVERAKGVLKPFKRLHYDEAAKILDTYWDDKLAKGTDDLPPTFKRFTYGDDFGAYDEVALTSQYEEPVIVHHYPAAIKAFYMKRDPNEPDKALAMDVLFPGFGEIIGGSQREDDYETLLLRLEEHNLPREAFEWYLDLRRYGSVPHAGFGLGLERLVMWICDLEHIRETIPFPRTLNRIWP